VVGDAGQIVDQDTQISHLHHPGKTVNPLDHIEGPSQL
jgi:hypothetical protein